ncbi:MAG: glycogen debranching enzyme GlgX, partial [Pseudomonadales bacterium]|nr:glycogen debranching enzyme GlgX [Pseudomonadales bacterium]
MSIKLADMRTGDPHQLGAHFDGEGCNFALFSAHAERVELCLFDSSGKQEVARVDLPEQTHEVWHGYLPGAGPGTIYGYRVHGAYDPAAGHRFTPNKLLVDPYARELRGHFSWCDAHFGYQLGHAQQDLSFDTRDNANNIPKCVVQPIQDQGGLQRPAIAGAESIIYELHTRGFTLNHPAIPAEQRGKFSGLSSQASIDYFRSLGVNCIELLPVHAFVDEHFLFERKLQNYWGYNSLSFFAPHSAYLGGAGVIAFRDMVDRLHDAGIEVILDVVYNHSCESNHLGPTLSLRGIDNAAYYRLQSENSRYYVNDTGCGNTLNVNHPRVLQLIMDSLRYWAQVMGVDGFRFDLAATLGREPSGFSQRATFLLAVAQDAVLS